MKHLEYKDTNNKAYKAYYDKFKKMVKQDLNGDGWFLLVKDFPFKDGDNLMFTAGEDIGKWHDKNLVSLYGKTKYIIGRCRKKGPVLTLLHFQEGDYVKEATESGLRKELKEYFKGTGVSVRTFKSLKVSDKEPEVAEEDAPDSEAETQNPESETSASFEALEMPKLTPTALKAVLDKAIGFARDKGVLEEEEFVNLVNAFKKAVPNMARMKTGLAKLNDYLQQAQSQAPPQSAPDTPDNSGVEKEISALEIQIELAEEEVTRLEGLLEKQDKERNGLLEKAESLVEQYNTSLKDESEKGRKLRFSISRDSMEIMQAKLPTLEQSIATNEKAWEEAIDYLISITQKAETFEASI